MGEEHQVIVGGSGKEMFDEIALVLFGRALAGGHADDTFTPATLRAESAHGRSLDETTVGDADDAALVGDQIFHVDLAFVGRQLGQAR